MAYQFRQGFFQPKFPEKYQGNPNQIVFRSSWERKLMYKLDLTKEVISWASEEVAIPYFDPVTNKMRRYFIDFLVTYRGKNDEIYKLAIEVKPYSQTIPPQPPKNKNKKAQMRWMNALRTYETNKSKWKSAEQWCIINGYKFIILTEKAGLFK
jgi:head completion protein|nr:MAG TPA: head completion protein [Caudoviricetes sp.]